jgi:hypothetical protein
MLQARYEYSRIFRRIRPAKNVNRIPGLQLTPGEHSVGVQREVTDRERADGVKGPDCDPLHRVNARNCAKRANAQAL